MVDLFLFSNIFATLLDTKDREMESRSFGSSDLDLFVV